ncbi:MULTISPECIES: ABC transporter ATP-binding protein [Streptomyces]|uniref:ABC transporter ATP-binding protein n=1 Tax=Streptomyces evansiae TaxID=3075535 RepID=A0ABU2R0L4_9ACTN|nr:MULTISPECIES: ABC transporter ATP-binding protein [unclassified Streptomyces]MDT0410237.1 ABC transporter ATP-binding protein [Streptomyces sp. DSM 41979]MYQ59654.1 ATP-binding cassette domain-containing protein [Streptomyces sp. SID4926]WEH30600.1 ABC transporter ATP-binding protein [Streptomyces sp. AM 3-1-1]SCE27339.1 amino acid/amide ABC transporter ATP-binding protein 1, HAAT family [Streptomyces sp. DfronAA-171]
MRTAPAPRETVVSAPPVLALEGVGWTVGGARILDDVSLEVREGEFLAFIGPNGAGKTSLFNLVSGLVPATSGRVLLDGEDLTRAAPHARARRGLGRTFQTSSLWPAMTVAEHVRLAAQAAAGGSYRVWRRAAPYREKVADVLERTGLAHRAEALASALSHGEKRKLELAVLLVAEPRLMLLDEPMAGVSAEEVPALTALIRSLHRDEGRTVLMVEHHMDVLLGLADRLAVMHHGRLLALDAPDAVIADETVQQAYLGEAL